MTLYGYANVGACACIYFAFLLHLFQPNINPLNKNQLVHTVNICTNENETILMKNKCSYKQTMRRNSCVFVFSVCFKLYIFCTFYRPTHTNTHTHALIETKTDRERVFALSFLLLYDITKTKNTKKKTPKSEA